MRKMLIALLGLVILIGASAFATSTRTLVMGNNNMIMVDDNNMFLFPGRVNNYPNLVLGEFDQYPDFYNVGLTWQFNDSNPWVLGTFVSYYPEFGPYDFIGRNMASFPYYSNYNYPYWWWYDYNYYDAPASIDQLSSEYPRRAQLAFGHKLGGQNFGFTAEIVRASWKAEDDSTQYVPYTTVAKQSFHQYTFGLGLTEATSGKWDVGLHFMTGGWTNENAEGNKINEPNGFYDLSASGRYFWVKNPKITLVPHAQVGIGKRGLKYLNATPNDVTDDFKVENTHSGFDLGMGVNYAPASKMLAVADIGFSYETYKGTSSGDVLGADRIGEHKEAYFTFPYLKIGFEGEVLSWMDIRVGGYTDLWTSSEKITSDFMTDQKWDTPSSDTYLGFGFHWGKLYLDTYTDPQIILDGLNFISGSTDAEDLNFQVSLLYEMF